MGFSCARVTQTDSIKHSAAFESHNRRKPKSLSKRYKKGPGSYWPAKIGGAAELLGVNPNILRHHRKKLGFQKRLQDIYSLRT